MLCGGAHSIRWPAFLTEQRLPSPKQEGIFPSFCWTWTVTLPWKSKLSIYSEDFRLDLHDYVSGQFLKINLSMKTHLGGSVFLLKALTNTANISLSHCCSGTIVLPAPHVKESGNFYNVCQNCKVIIKNYFKFAVHSPK